MSNAAVLTRSSSTVEPQFWHTETILWSATKSRIKHKRTTDAIPGETWWNRSSASPSLLYWMEERIPGLYARIAPHNLWRRPAFSPSLPDAGGRRGAGRGGSPRRNDRFSLGTGMSLLHPSAPFFCVLCAFLWLTLGSIRFSSGELIEFVAMEADFLDSAVVDDDRTADAKEEPRRKLFFESGESGKIEM